MTAVATESNPPQWRDGSAAIAMLTLAADSEPPVLAEYGLTDDISLVDDDRPTSSRPVVGRSSSSRRISPLVKEDHP